jgi:hypothetical protein
MNPGPASLLELLAQDDKARFIIPPWRRDYIWGTTDPRQHEVERLWQDLRAKCVDGKKYFCGVIILHKMEMEDAPTWEIVDGQQRVATLFLLLLALRDSCEKRGVDCNDLNNLLKAEAGDCRLILHGGISDDRRVMNTLLRRTGFSLEQKIKNENKVFLAYHYLVAQIEKEILSGSQEFLVSILQGVDFKIQDLVPTEQTRRAFETLDARTKQGEGKDATPEKPSAKPGGLPAGILLPATGGRTRSLKTLALAALAFVIILCVVAALWRRNYTQDKTAYYQEITSHYGIPEGMAKLSADQTQHRAVSYRVESSLGKISRVTGVNGAGQPVEDPARHHAATQEFHYHDDGSLDQVVFLNRNGREVAREIYSDLPADSGVRQADIAFKFQRRSAPAGQSRDFSLLGDGLYFNGSDVVGKTNITGEIVDYTADGSPKQIRYRTESRKPQSDISAVFARSFEYSPTAQVTKISNLGPDGKLSTDKSGVASLTRSYDASGNLIDESYFGVDGQPVFIKNGYAKVMYKYDDRGNKIEVTYLGADGQPVFSKQGFSKLTAKYDDHGQLIEQACFGINVEPVLNTEGYFTETLQYDNAGHVIEASFLGLDARPILNREGFATGKLKYDAKGNVIEEAYLGLDGQPTLIKDGYAGKSLKYDDADNVIEIDTFGLDHLPILGNNGYAKVTCKYDARGNKIETNCFDVAGNPVLNRDGFAKEVFEYDDQGDVTSQSYFDVDGHPLLNKDGVAKLTAKYDSRGNLLETLCYGLDNQPTLDKNGVARETYKYNDRDNAIEVSCFSVNGQAVLDRGGVAKAVFKYDDRGRKIEADYFGVDGQPILNSGGFARETFKYDDRGNMIEGAYFGASGQPILGPNGFAIETLKYDDHGRVIEGACFGLQGQPIQVGGAHRIVYTYDLTGKIIKTDRFDVAGLPAL